VKERIQNSKKIVEKSKFIGCECPISFRKTIEKKNEIFMQTNL
jgi:hypothetical protein